MKLKILAILLCTAQVAKAGEGKVNEIKNMAEKIAKNAEELLKSVPKT